MRILALLMPLLTVKGFLYILKFIIKSKINGAYMNTILLIGNKHQNSQTFFDNAKKQSPHLKTAMFPLTFDVPICPTKA